MLKTRLGVVAGVGLLGGCERAIMRDGAMGCADGALQIGELCVDPMVRLGVAALPVMIAIWVTVRFFDFMRRVETELRQINEKLSKPKD